MKRQLDPRLTAYLDARVTIPAGSLAPRAIFTLAATALVGIREQGGNNRGPIVELLQKTIGSADSEPWCMSLVQSCLAYAELKTGVVSPVIASEHCLTVWNDTPKAQRVVATPDVGAIIIWRHGNSDNGHTGVTLSRASGGVFDALEGNTESGLVGGKVERDGGGVYRTRRTLEGAGTMRIVGFLKPF